MNAFECTICKVEKIRVNRLWLTRFLRRKHLHSGVLQQVDVTCNLMQERMFESFVMCTPFLEPDFDRDTLLNKKVLMRQCKSYNLKVLVDYKNHNRFQALNFMFDQAPYHTTQRSKPHSLVLVSTSNGLTQFLHPADQSWMRPIFLIINC